MSARLACHLGALLLAGLAAPAYAADTACPAGPPLATLDLPHMHAALAGRQPVLVVAFGSSSIEGAMASDLAHSLPARLQDDLNARLPHGHVAVVNRGIGGQDAVEEITRLDRDVVALRPQVVIWQVGANGAMRSIEPATFAVVVAAGVARIQAAGADVILMDNQRTPQILAAPEHTILEQTLAKVAATSGVNLFSRGALMDAWERLGHPYAEFTASDGLHHNDLGYRCVAAALADAMTGRTATAAR